MTMTDNVTDFEAHRKKAAKIERMSQMMKASATGIPFATVIQERPKTIIKDDEAPQTEPQWCVMGPNRELLFKAPDEKTAELVRYQYQKACTVVAEACVAINVDPWVVATNIAEIFRDGGILQDIGYWDGSGKPY